MFHRFVNALELLAGVGALVAVVFLFANEPGGGSLATTYTSPGGKIYVANCARCHGAHGQGNIGPQLSGGVVVNDFPNVADQVAVVANGRGGMPAFGHTLSAAQIRQVVDFTRTGLR
jgi:mono/diheme cytochrome c family protein